MKSSQEVDEACKTQIATEATDLGANYTEEPPGFNFTDAESCRATVACCYACMECKDSTCMKSIANCDEFLADSFEKCEWEETEGGLSIGAFIGLVIVISCMIACGCVVYRVHKRRRSDHVVDLSSHPPDIQQQRWFGEGPAQIVPQT